MKACLLILLPLAAVVAVSPLTAAPAAVSEISTLTGKTYRDCHIVNVHPDGVSFRHANGAAKVLFTDLSQEWRSKLGYDPEKAAAYQLEQEQLRLKQAELRRQQDKAQTEALLMAQQIELARLRGIEVQARAELEAAAKAPAPYPPVVPDVQPLGAVFDSREYRGVGYRDRGWYGGGWGSGYYGYGGFPGGYYGGGYIGGHYCVPHVRGRIGGVTFTIGR